jgi:hypothetical protein
MADPRRKDRHTGGRRGHSAALAPSRGFGTGGVTRPRSRLEQFPQSTRAAPDHSEPFWSRGGSDVWGLGCGTNAWRSARSSGRLAARPRTRRRRRRPTRAFRGAVGNFVRGQGGRNRAALRHAPGQRGPPKSLSRAPSSGGTGHSLLNSSSTGGRHAGTLNLGDMVMSSNRIALGGDIVGAGMATVQGGQPAVHGVSSGVTARWLARGSVSTSIVVTTAEVRR